MTREDALSLFLCRKYDIEVDIDGCTNGRQLINTIYDDFEKQICNNCKHNSYGCSVQDSILQVDPEAIFTTFGCNGFESCK